MASVTNSISHLIWPDVEYVLEHDSEMVWVLEREREREGEKRAYIVKGRVQILGTGRKDDVHAIVLVHIWCFILTSQACNDLHNTRSILMDWGSSSQSLGNSWIGDTYNLCVLANKCLNFTSSWYRVLTKTFLSTILLVTSPNTHFVTNEIKRYFLRDWSVYQLSSRNRSS